MTLLATPDDYGQLIEPATVKIERLLPGPIERVWAYLTESELRRRWLAAGEMKLEVGAPFELVWRNDTLTDPPGKRPAGFGEEHRLQSRIIDIDPPRKLVFGWHDEAEVAMTLEPKGAEVLLRIVHSRLPNRPNIVGVSAGWHAHLDLLADIMNGRKPDPFWGDLVRLREEYERRVPA
jgi:uncharacterized protein YndB with AHSA1/START domain